MATSASERMRAARPSRRFGVRRAAPTLNGSAPSRAPKLRIDLIAASVCALDEAWPSSVSAKAWKISEGHDAERLALREGSETTDCAAVGARGVLGAAMEPHGDEALV